MTKLLLLTLIGLPATGKTTFCHTLSSYLNINTIHICFDQLFTITSENLNYYNSKRKEMIQLVENVIFSIQNSISLPENLKNSTAILNEKEPVFILIDDNNYYTGMRYEFYRICKKFKISFGQIYFELPLEKVMLRNSRRELSVPKNVILNMNDRLEKPCSSKNYWEKNTLYMSVINYDKDKIKHFLDESMKTNVEQVYPVLKDNLKLPQTKLHLIDLILRKNITKRITSAPPTEQQKLSRDLGEKKKNILRNIKTGIIELPENGYESIIEYLLD